MMLSHWNSLWAPAPGDPPAVSDTALWKAPWTPEQMIALQTRNWETMLATTHSWWTMMLSALPIVPAWPVPGLATSLSSPFDKATRAGAQSVAVKPSAERPESSGAATRKRSAAPRRKAAPTPRKR